MYVIPYLKEMVILVLIPDLNIFELGFHGQWTSLSSWNGVFRIESVWNKSFPNLLLDTYVHQAEAERAHTIEAKACQPFQQLYYIMTLRTYIFHVVWVIITVSLAVLLYPYIGSGGSISFSHPWQEGNAEGRENEIIWIERNGSELPILWQAYT